MEVRSCVKCGNESFNGLPLCGNCRDSLKDFGALAAYLNAFNGSKTDLLWIIGSEISSRESSVINNCKIEMDYPGGIIRLVPIEPSSSTLKTKPWLWDRFQNIKRAIDEIAKLRRAYGLVVTHYQIA